MSLDRNRTARGRAGARRSASQALLGLLGLLGFLNVMDIQTLRAAPERAAADRGVAGHWEGTITLRADDRGVGGSSGSVADATKFLRAAAAAAPAPAEAEALSLEKIMSDPDWIGNPPEAPYWADDGSAVYYRRKQQGHELRDLYRQELAGGQPRLIPLAEQGQVDVGGGEISHDRRRKVYAREGDIYVKELPRGPIRQLTRGSRAARDPHFMVGDERVSYRAGDELFIQDLKTGLVSQPAALELKKDPAEEEEPDFLTAQQRRLFEAIREKRRKEKEKRERERAERKVDPTRAPQPWYLGDKINIEELSLAPSGDWLLLVTTPKDAKKPKGALMPNYVTESGNVEDKEVRPKVAGSKPVPQSLLLLDLKGRKRYRLALDGLPGIMADPLKALREKAEAEKKSREKSKDKGEQESKDQNREESRDKGKTEGKDKDEHTSTSEQKDDETGEQGAREGEVQDSTTQGEQEATRQEDRGAARKVDRRKAVKERADGVGKDKAGAEERTTKREPRPVAVSDIEWSEDGSRAAVELLSADNKDRWIATVEPATHRLASRHRLSDPAWVNWDNNEIGWLRDSATLYFLSEESGTSHLYLTSVADGKTRPLTRGSYEVTHPRSSRDGRYLYYLANASHPGIHEVWRADVKSGESRQLTSAGGENDFELSPDGERLLLLHSEIARPREIYVQELPGDGAAALGRARRLTETTSAEFLAVDWTVPEVVAIPSTHVKAPIYSRVYTPKEHAAGGGGKRPAVVFVHGAGYLQDAHYGWSYYFHEFMFHTLLARRGYVVLDMDYRASAGYGRDWRTAIYRNMGHPELEDLQDGVAWLAANRGVDAARVCVYGGSYGGFLTLMALFREPQLFACGAALRPVTDWAHYNIEYTGAILNTPEIDPEAYRTSSPIEYAAGLARPLQICAGMQDDNVFFQDDVRLVERLIELKKENWDLAPYPLEAHGFKAPVAWLDEYRRVLKLFKSNLER